MYRKQAFTLIEILVVVVILGILAAIVVTLFGGATEDAAVSTTQTLVRTIQGQVAYQYSSTNQIPDEIDPAWFQSDLDTHPFDSEHDYPVFDNDAAATSDMMHPAAKIIGQGAGANGSFWFNPSNGMVRSRILDQEDDAENISLYNAVNNCNVDSLDQTTN
ncbi:MAG: type II secretion system protein [Phycisphaerales bacterium]|nr:type II secretion system protein [Phycisphaerales bacterium]